jgi:hypothetical protein
LSVVEFFVYLEPVENNLLLAILRLPFAGGRLAIVLVGLVPTNSLKEIWVQYKQDEEGGVIISLLAVLW